MFLSNQPCKVYVAPFDVRLPNQSNEDKAIYTVVQPDICVVCDLNKLDDKGCIGAPDIVVEILSPGNSKKELSNKYDVYQEAGVKEYWLIHPGEKSIFKYILNEDGLFYAAKPFLEGDVLMSDVLLGFELDLTGVFNES
jgi:Uma2 family endonuclease